MNVLLNAQSTPIDSERVLQKFLDKHAGNGPFAVAINEQFIPKTDYTNTLLNDGDRIDVVSPMQGG
ncbi:MAG: thiamine biosynthesis protein ThiS [Alteromonadaceae bacterium]|nr:MAG: thiamine biosynthesis protein ThiS [Alteromonadaceae bacterium]